MRRDTPIEHVQPGQTIHAHGYTWLVDRNEHDPEGNDGQSPRHVLYCHSTDGKAPEGYAENMSLGRKPGALVAVEVLQ